MRKSILMLKQHPAPALLLESALNHALPHVTAPAQLHPHRLELHGLQGGIVMLPNHSISRPGVETQELLKASRTK
jgi:hypothetical protein